MGFRNPFRIQVDENDVAYVSDYSPDAQTPQRSRGPVRHRPLSRSCASRPTTAGRSATSATSATTSGTSTSSRRARPRPARRWTTRRSRSTAAARRSCSTTRAGCVDGGPGFEPGLRGRPPVTDPDIWYSYRDNNADAPLGTPCFGYYATTPGPIAPGSTTECPRLFPELYTGGVGPHGVAKYHYDPANPNPKKFPPYYDNSVILGEFDAGHAARGQARRAEPHPQDQQLPGLRQPANAADPHVPRSSATTRWTCSSARTARSTC